MKMLKINKLKRRKNMKLMRFKFLKNEDGGLRQMAWVVGSAVVVTLVLVGAMIYVPDTAESFFGDAALWIRDQFGF